MQVRRAPSPRFDPPLYARAGRLVHTFFRNVPGTNVTDDFGNSVPANTAMVLWYVRGPMPSYQPEH
jgi:hypothetical protein